MSYPGNSALARDVQDRISNTFQQTLELVVEERDQEAIVGCEFILRMDPSFRPAKTLLGRLKSPERPVTVDDLRDGRAAADDRSEPAIDPLDQPVDLSLLDEPEAPPAPAAAASPPPAPAAATPPSPAKTAPAPSGLAPVIEDLLARRDFQRILEIAESQKAAVAGDLRVGEMVETARARLEAGSFVEIFVASAERSRDAGDLEQMERDLEKARSLDAEHPAILGFDRAPAPAPAAAAEIGEPPAGATTLDDSDLRFLQEQSLSLEAPEELPAAPPSGDGEELPDLEAFPLPDDLPELDEPAASEETLPEELPQLGEPVIAAAPPSGEAPRLDEPPAAGTAFEAGDLSQLDEISFEPQAPEPMSAEFGDLPELDELSLGGLGTPSPAAPASEPEPVVPAEPAAEPAAPAADGGGEGGERIAQLLEEGQQVFEQGEYQGAIDVWSRIFLLDIDNAEASRRIDEARKKKAELEREAEELFHEGVKHIEAKRLDEAKEAFGRALELSASHTLAREYLEQLEAGQVPVVKPTADLEMPGGDDVPDMLDIGAEAEASPSLEAAVERDRVVVVKKTDKRMVAMIAAVSLVAIAGGYYLMTEWDTLFPNRDAPPPVVQQVDPIARATRMHEAGNTENAIILLQRIQPQDPSYEDAQALVAQWKALVETPPQEVVPTGPSAEQVERYNLLTGAARQAHASRQRIRARRYFDRAARIAPLEEGDLALMREIEAALEPLEEEIEQFQKGEYEELIPVLWRQREERPDDADVELLLVDSYYNLALTDLQRGDIQGAAQKLKEALEVRPDSRELQRLHLFARTYVERPPDLLYRIFVKYLPSR